MGYDTTYTLTLYTSDGMFELQWCKDVHERRNDSWIG